MIGDLAAARSVSAERPLTVASDSLAQRTFRRARAQRASDGAGVWRAADYARGSGAVFAVLRFWPGRSDRFSTDRVQTEGQSFATVATAWERAHSPVLHPRKRSKLTPVVDGPHGWIIGYVMTESAAVLTYDGCPLAPPRTLEDVFAYARGYDFANLTTYQSRFAARILLDVDGRFVSLLGLRDVNSHRTVADWMLASDVVLGVETAPTPTFTAKNGRVAPAPELAPSQVDRARRVLHGVLERAGGTPMAAADVDVLGLSRRRLHRVRAERSRRAQRPPPGRGRCGGESAGARGARVIADRARDDLSRVDARAAPARRDRDLRFPRTESAAAADRVRAAGCGAGGQHRRRQPEVTDGAALPCARPLRRPRPRTCRSGGPRPSPGRS